MIKFTRDTLSKTEAGKLVANQEALTRKEKVRKNFEEDPNLIKRGYERGYVVFGDRAVFVRSRWEANMCAYYEFLKNLNVIQEWEYEPETFWFNGIKRGTNNYKPDYKLTYPILINLVDLRTEYVELKGYWTKKDTVKMNRMQKYHPNIVMVIIKEDGYKEIAANSRLYPGWGQPFLKKADVQHLLDAQKLINPIRKKTKK